MLDNRQKQLIFDFCLGFTSEEETTEVKQLIASSKEASQIYAILQSAISPLDAFICESCPNELVEKTLSRIDNYERSAPVQLEQLIADEESKEYVPNQKLWPSFGKILVAAALITIAIGIWFAPLDIVRQKYWQARCQMQMSNIFQGLQNYIADHGEMPAVEMKTDAPWWKVGYQGSENHSNTRNMWLLVKGGYVKPMQFVCPGCKQKRNASQKVDTEAIALKSYNDFPHRSFVTYSFRIRCENSGDLFKSRKILIADLNPLFEKIPEDYSHSFRIKLEPSLLGKNSNNHNRHGQNVLFGDGRVIFITERHTDISQDDIFTLQKMSPGCEIYGHERPDCESDAFLAP